MTDVDVLSSPAALRELWERCLNFLSSEIANDKYVAWIKPLHPKSRDGRLVLIAPNRFIVEWVNEHFLAKIKDTLDDLSENTLPPISVEVGNPAELLLDNNTETPETNGADTKPTTSRTTINFSKSTAPTHSNLNRQFTFDNFVKGKSNELAYAAAKQVADNAGKVYNPLFIYGGVGLGKTHLMHGIGNHILNKQQDAKVLYLHSERFVADMIKALQRNAMNEFKRYYRSVNCLLIDDIQFFAGKERSQEEFFHTFNTLIDEQQQIVLTCDRYPKEIEGLEERLQSRFGWGLTIAIEPPELDTRVAILKKKAHQTHMNLPDDVALFIAQHIQSNVRELEGALKRVIANAHFTGQTITVDFTREALKDLLTLQAKLVTVANIQKTTAEYYKIKVADLLSKRRNRSIARPRQIAMYLSKELTHHSLPEIGEAFGGRDHTTVLHACRKVKEMLTTLLDVQDDVKTLKRILSA